MNDFSCNSLGLIEDVFKKYAFNSLEDAYNLCKDKGIEVEKIVEDVNPRATQMAIKAYTLGVAISIKKETCLASYVAIDIGEGIQAFCDINSTAFAKATGVCVGNQASIILRSDDKTICVDDSYGNELDFMGLTSEELIKITINLSNEVERVMQS